MLRSINRVNEKIMTATTSEAMPIVASNESASESASSTESFNLDNSSNNEESYLSADTANTTVTNVSNSIENNNNNNNFDSNSMNENSGTNKLRVKCKSSGYNIKEIYNSLYDIDDQLNRELVTDYFFSDNYMLSNHEPSNQSSAPNGKVANDNGTKAMLVLNQKSNTNNSNLHSNVNSNNRVIEFTDWFDGINEWQPTHPYPSLKTYINSLNKRRKQMQIQQQQYPLKSIEIEFDQDLGLYLPVFKNLPNTHQLTGHHHHHHHHHHHLNTLNNNAASTRLFKELHKLVNNHGTSPINLNPSSANHSGSASNQQPQQQNPQRINSAQNRSALTIKTAELPSSLIYSQLQLRSDELDRVKSNNTSALSITNNLNSINPLIAVSAASQNRKNILNNTTNSGNKRTPQQAENDKTTASSSIDLITLANKNNNRFDLNYIYNDEELGIINIKKSNLNVTSLSNTNQNAEDTKMSTSSSSSKRIVTNLMQKSESDTNLRVTNNYHHGNNSGTNNNSINNKVVRVTGNNLNNNSSNGLNGGSLSNLIINNSIYNSNNGSNNNNNNNNSVNNSGATAESPSSNSIGKKLYLNGFFIENDHQQHVLQLQQQHQLVTQLTPSTNDLLTNQLFYINNNPFSKQTQLKSISRNLNANAIYKQQQMINSTSGAPSLTIVKSLGVGSHNGHTNNNPNSAPPHNHVNNNSSSSPSTTSSSSSSSAASTGLAIKPNLIIDAHSYATNNLNTNNAHTANIDSMINNNNSTSNTTSLPPIISGKRINLPLGPHRRRLILQFFDNGGARPNGEKEDADKAINSSFTVNDVVALKLKTPRKNVIKHRKSTASNNKRSSNKKLYKSKSFLN